jgi:hypothetical protein
LPGEEIEVVGFRIGRPALLDRLFSSGKSFNLSAATIAFEISSWIAKMSSSSRS